MKRLIFVAILVIVGMLIFLAGTADASSENMTMQRLVEFLEEDDTDTTQYFSFGKVVQVFPPDTSELCFERAMTLAERGKAVGIPFETESLTPLEVQKFYGTYISQDRVHIIVKVIIGEGWYFVEPSNDRVWLAIDLRGKV